MFRIALPATPVRMARRAYRRLWLARQIERCCRTRLASRQSALTVAVRQGRFAERQVVAIDRRRNHVSVSCQDWMLAARPDEVVQRLCGVLVVLADAPSECLPLVADISDGEDGGPGLLSFCSRDPDAILIPDHIFIRTRGYQEHRALARVNATEWDARSDCIIWRGQTTGTGAISRPRLAADDPDLLARVRLFLELKDTPNTDVKLHTVSQSSNHAVDSERLATAGILGDYISPVAWHGLKFAIDIDGNSNAWTNLFTRLIMGCCVLKVDSSFGYRQWYYGEIKPWTHYVPVKADLSDLRDRIAWCRANPGECRRIAARGQEFATARDFDTELASAVRRVCAAHERGLLRRRVD